MKNRVVYFDLAKGFAIFSVVLAHLNTFFWGDNYFLSYVIHSYFMPLFFFISGYFCYKENCLYDFSFLKRKIKQLLIPYLTACFLVCLLYSYLFQTDFLNRYLFDSSKGGYWFLLVLLVYYCAYLFIHLIASCCKDEVRNRFVFVALSLLIGGVIVFISYSVPLHVSYLFSLPELRRFWLSFSLGMIARLLMPYYNVWNNKVTKLSGILYFLIMVLGYNDKTITGFVVWLIASSLACLFIINIFRIFEETFFRLRVYGSNSLGIYIYHYIFIYSLKYFFQSFFTHDEFSSLETILIVVLLVVLSVVILELSLLLIRLTTKLKLKFLIGS